MPNIYSAGNQDPYGLTGGFLDQENPVVTFDKEIEAFKREAELLEKDQRHLIQVKTEFAPGGGVTTSFDFGGIPVHAMSQ